MNNNARYITVLTVEPVKPEPIRVDVAADFTSATFVYFEESTPTDDRLLIEVAVRVDGSTCEAVPEFYLTTSRGVHIENPGDFAAKVAEAAALFERVAAAWR
ncbi:hypothetical protein [Gordonia sp. (in: high G+C Gram-positive bacteria)]|uniref:hypothetical protein n=1 Tax=Gordonia sp. (in: high G+C Gram-positive bacteria) TaxID=84139 RepID=UPI003C7952ED